MNYFADTLPRVMRVGRVGDRLMFVLLAHPGAGGPIAKGVELKADNPTGLRMAGQEFLHQTPGSSSYVILSLPLEVMTDFSKFADHVPTGPDATRHTPPPAVLAKLRRLVLSFEALAEEAPAVIVSPKLPAVLSRLISRA